jgi:hypothetical protein
MAVVFPIRRSAWARVRGRFWFALVVTVGAFAAVQAELIETQAWKIALAGALLWWWVLVRAWGSKWSPFWIRIEPNWAAISRDYSIDPEEGHEFSDDALAKRYAPVDRITFTVLQENLAFRNDHQTFFSETDIEENFPGWEARHRRRMDRIVKKDQPHDPPTDYVESVYVYLYSSAATKREDIGYELGITTEKPSEKTILAGDRRNRIPLATLPYLALAIYWDTLDDMVSGERERQIKDALQRNGWTKEERHPEHPIHMPACLKHKFFTVYHNSV